MDSILSTIKSIHSLLKAKMDIDIYIGHVHSSIVPPYIIISASKIISNDTKTCTGYIMKLQTHIFDENAENILQYAGDIRNLLHNNIFDISHINACTHISTENFNAAMENKIIIPQSIVTFNLIIE